MRPNNNTPREPHLFIRMATDLAHMHLDLTLLPTAPCAVVREMESKNEWISEDIVREVLNHHLPNGTVVKTLPEVAAAFNMKPQSVKGDWRDGGMPGQPGAWDLVAITIWRLKRDASARGRHLQTSSEIVDAALEELSEKYGITTVIAGGERLSQDWANCLAECEAEV